MSGNCYVHRQRAITLDYTDKLRGRVSYCQSVPSLVFYFANRVLITSSSGCKRRLHATPRLLYCFSTRELSKMTSISITFILNGKMLIWVLFVWIKTYDQEVLFFHIQGYKVYLQGKGIPENKILWNRNTISTGLSSICTFYLFMCLTVRIFSSSFVRSFVRPFSLAFVPFVHLFVHSFVHLFVCCCL